MSDYYLPSQHIIGEVDSTSSQIILSPDDHISLFQRPVLERSSHDETILSNFLKRFPCFSPFINDPVKLLSISRLVNYEFFSQSEAIFHRGESSNKVYIIMKGSALVFIEIPESGKSPASLQSQLFEEENNKAEEQNPSSGTLKSSERGLAHLFKPKADREHVRQQTYLGTAAKKELDTLLNQELRSKEEVEWAVDVNKLKEELEHVDFNARLEKFSSEQKLLIQVNSSRPGKYIKSGIFQYHPKRRIHEGECFGEVGVLTNKSRVWSVLAEEDSHVLSIAKQNYIEIFQDRLKQQSGNKEFLNHFFPEADNASLSKLCHLFEEQHYVKNTMIYDDNQTIGSFYMIKEGQVELYKNFVTGQENKQTENSHSRPKKLLIAKIDQKEVFGDIEFFLGTRTLCKAVASSGSTILLKMRMDVFNELHKSLKCLFDLFKEASLIKAKARRDKIMHFLISEEAAHLESSKSAVLMTKNASLSPMKLPQLLLSSKVAQTQRALGTESQTNKIAARREGGANKTEPKLTKSESAHNEAKKIFMDLLNPDQLKDVLTVERRYKQKNSHRCKKCANRGHGDTEHCKGENADSFNNSEVSKNQSSSGHSNYLKRLGLSVAQQETIIAMSETSQNGQSTKLVTPGRLSRMNISPYSPSKISAESVKTENLMNKLKMRCITKHAEEKDFILNDEASSPIKRSPRLKPIHLATELEEPMINLRQLILSSNKSTHTTRTNYGQATTRVSKVFEKMDTQESTDDKLVKVRQSSIENIPTIKNALLKRGSLRQTEKLGLNRKLSTSGSESYRVRKNSGVKYAMVTQMNTDYE